MSRERKVGIEWDFFLAHAGGDEASAESLYRLLAPASRVFLAARCLRPGDNWDDALSEAQRRSSMTIVLISKHSKTSYYQREEIAAAIDRARKHPEEHRVVPIFMDSIDDEMIPYGLRHKHRIVVDGQSDFATAGSQLLDLLRSLRSGSHVSDESAPMVISAHMLRWSELDVTRFANDVFALREESNADAKRLVRISSPDLDQLLECVRSQCASQSDSNIVLDQQEAMQRARLRIKSAEGTATEMLTALDKAFGARAAISSVEPYLRLAMVAIVHDLGCYQLDADAAFRDISTWFSGRPSTANIVQYCYGVDNLVEIYIGAQPFPEHNNQHTKVYLPLGSVANDGREDLIMGLWEPSRHIRDEVWGTYVVPQMACFRAMSWSSYLVWDKQDSFYCTEGMVWRGDSSAPESVEPRDWQFGIVPRA